MHRVLSFQMGMSGRGFGESSEFVTKRMCFSFIFFFGFLALLGGFLLGRMSTERTLKLCEDRYKCVDETSRGVLDGTAGSAQLQYNLLLEELLQNTSFKRFNSTKKSEEYKSEDYHIDQESVKTAISNSSLFSKFEQRRSSLVATLLGSLEHDRWIVLSVSGDGTSLVLELIKIFGKLNSDHMWKPRRTIVFCFFDGPQDPCRNFLPKYSKSRIVAYLAVHGNSVQKKGCPSVSGSDIIKSLVLGTIQGLISPPNFNEGGDFDACKIEDNSKDQILVPRLISDVPHASISVKTINNTDTEFSNKREMLPYRRILARIIGLSLWNLSDSTVLHWDPTDFQRGVKTALKMINSSLYSEVKEKITSTTENLVTKVQSSNLGRNEVRNWSSLSTRMTNDLLSDLDRELLCPDIDSRSKTDLALIPGLLTESQEAISSFLESILKCYNDAVEVIQQG